jgi:hypothetical protein
MRKKQWFCPFMAAVCLTALAAGGCSGRSDASESVSAASSSVSSASSESSTSVSSESTPAPSEEASPTPTMDPSTMGEGAAPTDMPETDEATAAGLGDACVFTRDGQELYTVTITDISFTDRRAVVDTEEPEQVLVATYSYQSLTDEPVLVDDMSFRCIVNDTEVCTAYYLEDQIVADVAGKDAPVTAEVAYSVPADTEKVSLYLTNTANPDGENYLITVENLQQ